MEKVYGVGRKNLQTNFRIEELFSAGNVSRYLPVYKKPSYVNTEDKLVGVPYDPDVPASRMNTSLNIFQVNFSIYFPVSIFIVLLAKSSKWKKHNT